jgi:hypothetical protein
MVKAKGRVCSVAVVGFTIASVIGCSPGNQSADKDAAGDVLAPKMSPMTQRFDSADTQKLTAMKAFAASKTAVNPYTVKVESHGTCDHRFVALTFETFKGAGSVKFDDYQSSGNSYPVGQITNNDATCTSAGLQIEHGRTAIWWVSGGYAHFVDSQSGKQIAQGSSGSVRTGVILQRATGLPRRKSSTCDHQTPTGSFAAGAGANTVALDATIDGGYTIWVNCSDTSCHVDPGYPRRNKDEPPGAPPPPGRRSRNPRKRSPRRVNAGLAARQHACILLTLFPH